MTTTKKQIIFGAAIAIGTSLLTISCSEKDEDKKKTNNAPLAPEVAERNDADSLEANLENENANGKIPDYTNLYCKHVYRLKLRADVNSELSYFCNDDNTPTDDMIAMREAVLNQEEDYVVRLLKEKHDEKTEISDFILAWGYYVDIRPFEVKGRPLYEFIAKNIVNDLTTMTGKTQALGDEQLDHGLHLWSANMNYDLSVKASNGLSLDSKRGTQYNMYQVESANEEMGLGVEALTDVANPNYQRSVMINLSFNDGTGYNDGVGGTVVLNLLHIKINNKGFPLTAAKTVDEISKFLAKEMHAGLSQ